MTNWNNSRYFESRVHVTCYATEPPPINLYGHLGRTSSPAATHQSPTQRTSSTPISDAPARHILTPPSTPILMAIPMAPTMYHLRPIYRGVLRRRLVKYVHPAGAKSQDAADPQKHRCSGEICTDFALASIWRRSDRRRRWRDCLRLSFPCPEAVLHGGKEVKGDGKRGLCV